MDIEKYGEGLSEEDLRRLVRIRQSEETVLSAIKELNRRKSSERLELYQEVLDDPGQSRRTKSTIAAELGTERSPENQAMLLKSLEAGDARLFAASAKALGKIGDEAALEVLEKKRGPQDAAARKALSFSRSLIAYRLRLDRHLIAQPGAKDLVEVKEGVTFKTGRASAEEVRQVLAQTRQSLPAIRLSPTGVAKDNCQGYDILQVFNEDLRQLKDLQTLSEHPALLLVLLKRGLSLGHYFLDHYLFTQPLKEGKEIALLGTRPRGDPTYAGRLKLTESGFAFTLRSVDTRYAPAIDVEGSFDAEKGAWQFTRALTSQKLAAVKNVPVNPQKASVQID